MNTQRITLKTLEEMRFTPAISERVKSPRTPHLKPSTVPPYVSRKLYRYTPEMDAFRSNGSTHLLIARQSTSRQKT